MNPDPDNPHVVPAKPSPEIPRSKRVEYILYGASESLPPPVAKRQREPERWEEEPTPGMRPYMFE